LGISFTFVCVLVKIIARWQAIAHHPNTTPNRQLQKERNNSRLTTGCNGKIDKDSSLYFTSFKPATPFANNNNNNNNNNNKYIIKMITNEHDDDHGYVVMLLLLLYDKYININ
jgi:hypothetical protein